MPKTPGAELLQRIQEGRLEQAPSAYLTETRDRVCSAIEELLDVGARIRPLLSGKTRIGWVRGVHLSERKLLGHWITDEIEMILQLLRLGTTLTEDELRDLSTVEMRNLARLVQSITASDLKLFPYLSRFATTGISEQLWFARGREVTQIFLPGFSVLFFGRVLKSVRAYAARTENIRQRIRSSYVYTE